MYRTPFQFEKQQRYISICLFILSELQKVSDLDLDLDLGSHRRYISMHGKYCTTSVPEHVTVASSSTEIHV